jgi:hypothetical protein
MYEILTLKSTCTLIRIFFHYEKGNHGDDRLVIGFTAICAISIILFLLAIVFSWYIS